MFCPKCGAQNPETGKFCRTCGSDLSNVTPALAGKTGGVSRGFGMIEPIQPMQFGGSKDDKSRRSDPNDVYGDAVKSIISGVGFLIVSMALLFTGVAGGRGWWWAMLFPALTFLAKGISEYLKYGKMEKSRIGNVSQTPARVNQTDANAGLPSPQTEFFSPESRYKTGDLVPPSVTEGTSKLIKLDSEGQTMTLPKQRGKEN